LAGWVSQPILDLAGVARAVAAGDVTRRAQPAGAREMVEVAEAFNAMLDGRIQAEKALQTHRDGLEALVAERTAHLERARDAAEVAYRAKTVFLATMTHELRSPLNAILGFSGLLLQRLSGPLNDEQATYLGYIQDGARRLLGLISDLLDSSRIEAGAVEVRWEPADIPALIDQALNSTRLKAEAKGLALHAEVDPAVGEVLTDGGRLTQILVNLLDNAVKFTDAGEVRLQADIEVGAPGNLRMRISDTGIGIAEDQLEHIFEPFIQVDHGATRRYEGSGLGLSISKRLADLLGGSLEAQSQLGQGSVFTLRLPLDPKVTL
jgi:signal transduction histidine kinase